MAFSELDGAELELVIANSTDLGRSSREGANVLKGVAQLNRERDSLSSLAIKFANGQLMDIANISRIKFCPKVIRKFFLRARTVLKFASLRTRRKFDAPIDFQWRDGTLEMTWRRKS